MERWGYAAGLLLGLLVGVAAVPALAHPHAWIDLRSTIVLDAQGHVVAIEQEWLFDEIYTLFALDGYKGQGAALQARMEQQAQASLASLHDYDYFTEIRIDGAKQAPAEVTDYASELRRNRWWLRFTLPLPNPVDPTAHKVTFAVFDPSYYIEILHREGDVVSFRGVEETACHGMIWPPNPSTEALILAASMDVNAQAEDGLGALFAETVEIRCP